MCLGAFGGAFPCGSFPVPPCFFIRRPVRPPFFLPIPLGFSKKFPAAPCGTGAVPPRYPTGIGVFSFLIYDLTIYSFRISYRLLFFYFFLLSPSLFQIYLDFSSVIRFFCPITSLTHLVSFVTMAKTKEMLFQISQIANCFFAFSRKSISIYRSEQVPKQTLLSCSPEKKLSPAAQPSFPVLHLRANRSSLFLPQQAAFSMPNGVCRKEFSP